MQPKDNDAQELDFIREMTTHQTAIGAFLKSMLPIHADIESLLQEVNVTLWQKKASFKPGSNFKAWAFQTAKYHALNERRRLKRSRLITLDDAVLEALAKTEDFEDDTMRKRRKALDSCLLKLNPKERNLVKFRYTKNLSLEQYSRTNQVNAGTLRSMLRRIRNKLKNCINLQLEENEYR